MYAGCYIGACIQRPMYKFDTVKLSPWHGLMGIGLTALYLKIFSFQRTRLSPAGQGLLKSFYRGLGWPFMTPARAFLLPYLDTSIPWS